MNEGPRKGARLTDEEFDREVTAFRAELAALRDGTNRYGTEPTLGEVREFLKAKRPIDDPYARLLILWLLVRAEDAPAAPPPPPSEGGPATTGSG